MQPTKPHSERTSLRSEDASCGGEDDMGIAISGNWVSIGSLAAEVLSRLSAMPAPVPRHDEGADERADKATDASADNDGAERLPEHADFPLRLVLKAAKEPANRKPNNDAREEPAEIGDTDVVEHAFPSMRQVTMSVAKVMCATPIDDAVNNRNCHAESWMMEQPIPGTVNASNVVASAMIEALQSAHVPSSELSAGERGVAVRPPAVASQFRMRRSPDALVKDADGVGLPEKATPGEGFQGLRNAPSPKMELGAGLSRLVTPALCAVARPAMGLTLREDVYSLPLSRRVAT